MFETSQDSPAGFEGDDRRGELRWMRLAFGLAAFALGLQAADLALHLYTQFFGDEQLFGLMRRPQFVWLVGTPITWGAALSSYLLIGRYPEPRWNRRAALLALMNTFDVLLWCAEHAHEWNMTGAFQALRDDWFRLAASVLQWCELLLFAGLASEFVRRQGSRDGVPLLAGVRATAMLGVLMWGCSFVLATSLRFGWIQRIDRRVIAELMLMQIGSLALLMLTAFQVTVLCALTARLCGKRLAELKGSEWGDDLLKPQDEGFPTQDDPKRR